ncbi:MAG: DUF3575 domain-containing protein [Dysgonomonas sp.]|nr:DUF3575 domain-containing protein [Dysgonomonas sp.]
MLRYLHIAGIIYMLFFTVDLYSQEEDRPVNKNIPASIGFKSNMLYNIGGLYNMGIETMLSYQLTTSLSVNYSPWEPDDNKRMKLLLFQNETRYWFCNAFFSHFVGLQLSAGQFNVGGLDILGTKEGRYQGTAYSAGLTYGYNWILSPRWNIEASIGLGYVYVDYDKYRCGDCGRKLKEDKKGYWGPTHIGVSLIYILK